MANLRLKHCDGCQKDKPIWKNVFVDGERKRYCKLCWSCQDNQNSKPTTRKPLASRSAKKIAQDKEYSPLRKEFLEKNPVCSIAVSGCTHEATDVHHMDGRLGERYLDITRWKSSCRNCHTWVETHPLEAREMGFSGTKH